ncbi:MAG: hypothetical protein GX256_02775 [Fretibacterium sp.]|nr:hypothetical protein [Fretibacterium sp.]
MSLWEKWEREKLAKQGIHVEVPRDVEIHETYSKPNLRKQVRIVLLTLALCLVLVALAVFFEAFYTGKRWSETYFVRLLVSKEQQREDISRRNP